MCHLSAFQVTALSKLDMIIENPIEMLGILRQIASANRQCVDRDLLEDIMPNRIDSVAEMDNFNQSLAADEYKKKMVILGKTIYAIFVRC
jgi:hypothetical protein